LLRLQGGIVKVEEALLANPKLAMSVFSTLKTQNVTGRVPTLAEWHEAFLLEEKLCTQTIDKLIEQARKDLARKRLAAARRQRERLLFTLERRATLTLKENRHV
jgi:hypothetical protein